MTIEERDAQLKFIGELVRHLDPNGAVETQLARTIALDNWRLDRLKILEATVPATNAVFENIALHASRLNRSIRRNLDLLLQLQATRKTRERKSRLAPVIDIAAHRK